MENERKIEVKQHTAGYFYSGKILTDILRDVGRDELIDHEGNVWSSRNPKTVPSEPDGEHTVSLEMPGGAKQVHSHVLALAVIGGCTIGDLQRRFEVEGLDRGDAMRKAFREYPSARADFILIENRKQEAKKR